jgi:transposase-like protein
MRNPRAYCPNPACEHWRDPAVKAKQPPPPIDFYIKKGYRTPKHNHQPVPVYQCRTCCKKFSATLVKPIRNQKRPDLNKRVFDLAVSGASVRRISILLDCNRDTVLRKIEYLAQESRKHHAKAMEQLAKEGGTSYVMMDELETFIHARHKQVSVPAVIRVKTGHVLAIGVARMPSNMKLGGAGVGPLPPGGTNWQYNDRPKVVPGVFAQLAPVLKPRATIATDGETSYPKWIRQALPGAVHVVHHSPKETGLGRAKKRASGEPRENDPLFAINVLFAKARNDLAKDLDYYKEPEGFGEPLVDVGGLGEWI